MRHLLSFNNHITLNLPLIFFKSSILSKGKKNRILLAGCIEKSRIILSGTNNIVEFNGLEVNDSSISIYGNNNSLLCDSGVRLRNVTIIIRGSDCKIQIGKNTTFGGIRMINVGKSNNIIIGEDCLFSDNIEIWASDTHSIFDSNGKQINHEKPVLIGNHVWVGAHVIILKGVSILDGSIVGMGSIVSKDVKENVIAVGNPTRVVKENISWSIDY